jgi:hypothetical protein
MAVMGYKPTMCHRGVSTIEQILFIPQIQILSTRQYRQTACVCYACFS